MNHGVFHQPASASAWLAPDLMLPQRDLLLDEREFARRLAELLGAGRQVSPERCQKQRVKYRIGESLRVLYRVEVDGRNHLVAARTSATNNRKFDFWLYPNDRKVKCLESFSRIPRSLARIGAADWIRSELVAYAPEKCATAKCLDAHGAVIGYAKIYAGNEGQRVFQTYRALSASSAVNGAAPRIAKAVAYSKRHRLLLLESLQGNRVADLKGSNLLHGFHGLGGALASLHHRSSPQGLSRFERLDVKKLQKAAMLIGQARPDVAELAFRLSFELCAQLPPDDDLVCLHGDVHPKNGIVRNGEVTLIDLDQCAVGPAAADLGSLLAACRYYRCVGAVSEAAEEAIVNNFLPGYQELQPLPNASSLRWHTAAALLGERALRAVNRIRPQGLLHLRSLLTNAREILSLENRRP